jgi:hypothetical protein
MGEGKDKLWVFFATFASLREIPAGFSRKGREGPQRIDRILGEVILTADFG